LAEYLVFSQTPIEEAVPFQFIFVAWFVAGAMGAIALSWGSGLPVLGGAAGFGCGFVLTSFAVMFTTISLQASAGPEYSWGATGCGTGFAVGGAIGAVATTRSLTGGILGALTFGFTGAAWGPLLFWLSWYHGGALPEANHVPLAAVILLFPFVMGGLLWGAALGLFSVEDES